MGTVLPLDTSSSLNGGRTEENDDWDSGPSLKHANMAVSRAAGSDAVDHLFDRSSFSALDHLEFHPELKPHNSNSPTNTQD